MLRSSVFRQLALSGRYAAAAAQGPTGWWAVAPAAACGVSLAGLHSCAALLASLQVKIPALGESISDGTVAAVLKEPGQRVEEDEPILQIETDKVTVDVRAPRAGVLEAILVKPDDNVEVGHVVASIAEGEYATAGAPDPQQQQQQQQEAAAPPLPPAPPAVQAAAPAAPAEPAAAAHRTPAIRFPPRRTAEGERISGLPAEQAEQLLASLLGGGSKRAAAKPAPIPEEYRHMIAVPIVGGSMPVLRGMPVPPAPPGPPRRLMSDSEMEAIMLGGAEP